MVSKGTDRKLGRSSGSTNGTVIVEVKNIKRCNDVLRVATFTQYCRWHNHCHWNNHSNTFSFLVCHFFAAGASESVNGLYEVLSGKPSGQLGDLCIV